MGLISNKIFGKEHRRQKREPLCVLVEDAGRIQEYFDKSFDISNHGIFIQTEHPRQKGTLLKLRFALPGRPPLTVKGRVAHVKKKGMGIEFTQMDPVVEKIIADFIA